MIRIANLSKRYTIYDRPLDRLWDWAAPRAMARGREFWALRDLTLEVPRGTSLGVVGVNGAGKSTLLKILTGTTVPTLGAFEIDGRVSALLELGMGFQMDFTGRENIALSGMLAGLGGEELEARTPEIVEFAELGDFIDQHLRTYSSGMLMRLGFALASSVDPDVLIVDEALSVGDLHFQRKCLRRIHEFHERGITVLFVSHDPSMVKTFCDEAILLDAGRLLDRGSPSSVLDHYNALLAEKYRDDGPQARIIAPAAESPQTEDGGASPEDDATPPLAAAGTGHRTGNFEAVLARVALETDAPGSGQTVLTTGAAVTFVLRAVALEPVPAPTFGILIKDRLGNEVYGVNTHGRLDLPDLEPGAALEVRFAMPLNLGPGPYTLTAALHEGPDHTGRCYDWIEAAVTFHVAATPADPFTGVCRLPVQMAQAPATPRPDELALAKRLRAG